MDRTSKRRWAVLGPVLLACVIAAFYPTESPEVAEVVAERPAITSAAGVGRSTAQVAVSPQAVALVPEMAWQPLKQNPFAPRGWTAPPPPPPPAPKIVQPVLPPEPPGPPPLPFKFMGRMLEETGEVVYLSRGEQIILVRGVGELERDYKVLRVDAQEMEFEHVPTASKQVLRLGGNS